MRIFRMGEYRVIVEGDQIRTGRMLFVIPLGLVLLGVQGGKQPVRRPFLLGQGIFGEYKQGGQCGHWSVFPPQKGRHQEL